MPSSTVIVPVFNQAALTESCLQALLKHVATRIIVVDDASTDETRQMLSHYRKKIDILTHEENLGFAASCNHAAAVAQSEYLVFLNNDTVPQTGWLTALESYAFNNPEATVIGSKLLYADTTIQHAGVVICQDRYPRHIYTGFPSDHPAVNKARSFQIVTAACMLVRRDAFEEIEGFDPAFRNGFEDVDLCLRLGQKSYSVHYCPSSVVHHLESVSPGRFRNDRENVSLYRERWISRVRPDDVEYYIEDGLLQLTYEGRYPLHCEISPLLASMDSGVRTAELERLLQQRNRQVADLSRETTRLSLELGALGKTSPGLSYTESRRRIVELVQKLVPGGSKVLVISKGDGALIDFSDHEGWHFPQGKNDAYAGYHPADSTEAISHLETLRDRGGEYLLIPAVSLWWLEHYSDFQQHLETHYVRFETPEDLCVLYKLSGTPTRPSQSASPPDTQIEGIAAASEGREP